MLTCLLDLSHIAGLLGVNEVNGELYGVSVDRRDRLVNTNWIGRGAWKEVVASEWDKIKDSLNKVVEIPNIPVTGLSETDQPLSVLTLTANSGDRFSGKLRTICIFPCLDWFQTAGVHEYLCFLQSVTEINTG